MEGLHERVRQRPPHREVEVQDVRSARQQGGDIRVGIREFGGRDLQNGGFGKPRAGGGEQRHAVAERREPAC